MVANYYFAKLFHPNNWAEQAITTIDIEVVLSQQNKCYASKLKQSNFEAELSAEASLRTWIQARKTGSKNTAPANTT